MIVVTAATGQLGRLVIDGLLERVPANQLVAAVRDPAKAADLAAKGVDVRQADYTDSESLALAFKGADKVLLISGSEVGQRVAQHTNAIEAAKAANVGHLVYTSVLHADTSTLSLAVEHLATEKVLQASGLTSTILRNGWYTENYGQPVTQSVETGVIIGSAGDGQIYGAARKDYAAAAVEVLTGTDHENKVYELAGDNGFTLADLAAAVTKASGREVRYDNLTLDAHKETLVGFGLPAEVAAMLAGWDQGISTGDLADTSGELSRLIGRPTTPLAGTVADLLV
ncbi:SDR family oxidoreductase [Kribbella sp. NBC_01245]|uniref:SDR family oxidoreductase n=1 Tax=Kribbella sp. NBC_01245 TaxID=2903578 RepID=UPI002E2C8A35|nr:SDR family oxidoreductase [Kribbella sp. NBC_01245]